MKTKTKVVRSEFLYYIALFCEVIAMQIGLMTLPYQIAGLSLLMKMLRYAGYAIVLVKLYKTDFTTGEMIRLMAIVLLMAIRIPAVGRASFLVFLFIYGMKGIEFEKLARAICIWMVLGVVITIAGAYSGVMENWGYNLNSDRPRYAIGYFYPSHATSAILYTVLLMCYVLKERLKFWHVIALELFNLWQYTKTDSRTGTAVIAVALLVFWGMKFLDKDSVKTVLCRLLSYSFLLSAAISLLGALFYDKSSQIWLKLNAFFNRRLALAHDGMEEFGIRLLGQKIDWVGYGGLGHVFQSLDREYNYVDCSYIKILLSEGAVFWILILAGFTLACRKAAYKRNIYLCTALAFTAVYSIIEPRLCEIGFNPFMLMLAVLIDYRGEFISSGGKSALGVESVCSGKEMKAYG